MGHGFAQINHIPTTFRLKTIGNIFSRLKKGQSIQLIGPTGSGKSLVLKAITQSQRIQKLHLGSEVDSFRFVLVDLKFSVDKELKSVLKFFNSKLESNLKSEDVPSLVEEIEKSVSKFTKGEKHLVIVMDSFNELPNPAKLFEVLKGLYDQNRGRLSYIFAVNHEIDVNTYFDKFKNLASILTENLIYISPLEPEDYKWFIKQIENHLDLKLNSGIEKKVYVETHGFMATIKRVLETLRDGDNINDILSYPEKIKRLSYHFHTLLKDLEPERDILMEIINEKNTTGKNIDYLVNLGILNKSGDFIFPMFKTYLKNTLLLQREKSKEIINDTIRLNTQVTALEFKVLKFLCNKLDNFCSREEIIEDVWGEKANNGIADHALDQLIYRLRMKLKKNDPQLKIVTVWGRGHKATLQS